MFAIVENGVVVNIIVATRHFVAAHLPDAISIEGITPQPGIGWRYEGGCFIPSVQEQEKLV